MTLVLMGVQTFLRPFRTIQLAGSEDQYDPVSGSWENLSDGAFQLYADRSLTKTYGFREWFVRLYNEVLYTVWGEHHPQVIEGKEGYLFERGYRNSIMGEDFLGYDKLMNMADSLELLNQRMKDQGKLFVVMIAPNKWRNLNYLTPYSMRSIADSTNYSVLVPALRSRGIMVMDWIAGFDNMRSDEPLFSKQGAHWSIMGGARAAYMFNGALHERGLTEASVSVERMERTDKPRNTDKDLFELMNLIRSPREEILYYPTFRYNGIEGPRALIVGDSYYWTFYYLGLHQRMFAPGSKFFYYHSTACSDDPKTRISIDQNLTDTELSVAKVVVLMMSEPSISLGGYGFLEAALKSNAWE